MILRRFFLFLIFITNVWQASSQVTYVAMHDFAINRAERILYSQNKHTALKPFLLPKLDFHTDSTKQFRDHSIFSKSINNWQLDINPIINSMYGLVVDQNQHIEQYGAGFQLRLTDQNHWTLETNIAYQRTSLYDTNTDYQRNIPHYWQAVNQQADYSDYWLGKAYVSYSPVEELNVQLGYDKHFIGNGYRSLLLSDHTAPYPFVRATANVWNIQYAWFTALLNDYDTQLPTLPVRQKYLVAHHLSWNVTNWLNLSFYEAVLMSETDSLGNSGFSVHYLNPVVFYRPVEFANGSADNVLMGLHGKLRVGKRIHLYSQLILDEFVLSEIKAQNGWWGNKQGIQLGMKVFDGFWLKNSTLILEYNHVRPFTYSHNTPLQNYGAYYQPLAHPLGANFQEALVVFKYYYQNWDVRFRSVAALYGTDNSSISYGQDIYKSYTFRDGDYGHTLTQGVLNKLVSSELQIGYLLHTKMQLYAECTIGSRNIWIETQKQTQNYIQIGIKTRIYNESLYK